MAPRKIKSPKQLAKAWDDYKDICDNSYVARTEFSQKNGVFVTQPVPSSISYTIEGFCVYLGLGRQNFYGTYDKDPAYHDIITRIREECEVDVRKKFEKGILNAKLAPLWMSKFGYTTKAEEKVDADTNLTIKVDYGDDCGEKR